MNKQDETHALPSPRELVVCGEDRWTGKWMFMGAERKAKAGRGGAGMWRTEVRL